MKYLGTILDNKDIATKKYVDDVEAIAKGANQAVSFGNYSTMITALNALAKETYRVGQNIYIVTTEVPDLWVSYVTDTSVSYTYVSDVQFINELKASGSVQVGFFKVSALETQKVDLTGYYTKTEMTTLLNGKVSVVSGKGLSENDYTTAEKTKLSGIAEGANKYTLPTASASTLGGVKVGTNLSISSGVLSATDTTYTSQAAASGGTAVSLCTTGEKYTWNAKLDASYGKCTTASAITSLTNSAATTVLATISAAATLGLASSYVAGKDLYIIIRNSGSSAIKVTLPATLGSRTAYYNGVTGATSMTIPAGQLGELTVVTPGSSYAIVRTSL